MPFPSTSLQSPPPFLSPHPQWSAHKAICKKPSALPSVPFPSLASIREACGVPTQLEEEARLYPGCRYEARADPAELASLIRAFLAPVDGTHAAGVEAQINAGKYLGLIAYESVADARAIVSAEGLLRRIESNLAATNTEWRSELSLCSIAILSGAAYNIDNTVCDRIAEEATLRRTILRIAVLGLPAGRGDRSPTPILVSSEAQRHAAVAFMKLSFRPALVGVCARDVDALSDADLKALVDGGVSRERDDQYTESVVGILGNCCSRHAPLLRRLVGPAGLPLAGPVQAPGV